MFYVYFSAYSTTSFKRIRKKNWTDKYLSTKTLSKILCKWKQNPDIRTNL